MPNPLLCTGSMIFRFILGVCVEFAFDDCASNFDCFEVPVRQLFLKSTMAHEKRKNDRGRKRKRGILKKDKLRACGWRMNQFKIGVIVGRILDAERTGKSINLTELGRYTGNPCPSTHSFIAKRARMGEFSAGPPRSLLKKKGVAHNPSGCNSPKDH